MGIVSVFVRRHDDPEERALERQLRQLGCGELTAVKIERVYRFEGDIEINAAAAAGQSGV